MWNAVEASLLALAVAVVVRHVRLSAPARHALWLIVLLRLFVPPVGIHSCGLGACCTKVLQSVYAHARDQTTFPTLGLNQHDADIAFVPTLREGTALEDVPRLSSDLPESSDDLTPAQHDAQH